MLVHTNDTAIRRRPGCLPQSTQSPGCEDVTGDIALIAHRAWTRQQLTTTTKTISTDNGRATRWTAVAARDAINTCHRAHRASKCYPLGTPLQYKLELPICNESKIRGGVVQLYKIVRSQSAAAVRLVIVLLPLSCGV